MAICVKLDEIIEGLEFQSDEKHSFLDKKTISSLKISSIKDFCPAMKVVHESNI